MSRRLRVSQGPPVDAPLSTGHSSSSSTRTDRPTRSANRQDDVRQASVAPNSPVDDMSGASAPETRQTRLQRRAVGPDGALDNPDNEELDDDEIDGEVTRCVCGQAEYPGPPVPLAEINKNQARQHGRSASSAGVEPLPEDAGGLFIQCDSCSVWQHGGCVGIMEEAATPENYYCEQCRKDLHRVMTGAKGQRYSRYLPVVEPMTTRTPRRVSGSREIDKVKEAEMKLAAFNSAKRRSTMNSRAAFDEEEMLRKAIEESKGEGDSSGRRPKRGRDDDSEGTNTESKRRKTSDQESATPEGVEGDAPSDEESRRRGNGRTRLVHIAQKERERKQREQREQQKEREAERAEAAGRRKGRAERRRADGRFSLECANAESEVPEEPKLNAPRTANIKKLPPKPPATGPPSAGKKKPMTRRRVGRNQYTRDRDDDKSSPKGLASKSSDDAAAADKEMLVNGSKPSKPRTMNPNRTSMNDLRKRAAGILEYITQTQVELAGRLANGDGDDADGKPGAGAEATDADAAELANADAAGTDEDSFKGLSSLQMMDVLTRELVLWQKDYGRYGEKAERA